MTQQILKLPEVMKATGLSSTSIYRLASKSRFPQQIKLSERSSGWLESEVQQWLQERIEASRNNGEVA